MSDRTAGELEAGKAAPTSDVNETTTALASMRGPTPFSNWVIPGKLIAGAYPGDALCEAKHRDVIASIIDAGVTVFVCLMTEGELTRFRPYQEVAIQYTEEQNKQPLKFLSLSIPDHFITWDKNVLDFIPKVADAMSGESQCIYVHCWGGHGRTGVVIALMLAYVQDLDAERALYLTGLYHGQREVSRSRSPQTSTQIKQVQRLVPLLRESKTTDGVEGTQK